MSSQDSPNRTRRSFRRLNSPTVDGSNDHQPDARLSAPRPFDDAQQPPPLLPATQHRQQQETQPSSLQRQGNATASSSTIISLGRLPAVSTPPPAQPVARSLRNFDRAATPTPPRAAMVSPPPPSQLVAAATAAAAVATPPSAVAAIPYVAPSVNTAVAALSSSPAAVSSASVSSGSTCSTDIAKASTFVVTDAIVAVVLVEGRGDSSGMLPSAVWTADESSWIRIRDPTTGDVIRQWRLRGSNNNNGRGNFNSDSNGSNSISARRSATPPPSAANGNNVAVTAMWASPRHVPSQLAVVLCGRDDGLITVYSASTAAHLADLALHEGLVSAFVPCDQDAMTVASCSFDGRVALWDVRSLRCVTSTSVGASDALMCMTSFPVSSGLSGSSSPPATWWLAVGGQNGALHVYRALDLTTIAREENSARENQMHDTRRTTSPPRTSATSKDRMPPAAPASGSATAAVVPESSSTALFAMTAMVCVPRSCELTGTKHIWCGFSDGSIVIYSAALSSGIDRVQQVSAAAPHAAGAPPRRVGPAAPPAAISHMSEPAGDDRVWVFTVDGFLSIFDTHRRCILQRIAATATASSASLRYSLQQQQQQQQQQHQGQGQGRRKDLMTCISPVAVSRVWRIWTCSQDGTVSVWNSHSVDSTGLFSSAPQQQQQQQAATVESSSSVPEVRHQQQPSRTAHAAAGSGVGLPVQHSVPIHEVELLRAKLGDFRAELEQAQQAAESARKIAALDMEAVARKAADDVRSARLAQQDAEDRLESFRDATSAVERQLRGEIQRLEDDITRLQRRSVDRASASAHAFAANHSAHRAPPTGMLSIPVPDRAASHSQQQFMQQQQQQQQQELVSTIDLLRSQLAEARAQAAAYAVAHSSQGRGGSSHGGLTSPLPPSASTTTAVIAAQQQQQQILLVEQQRLALQEREFEQHVRRDREQQSLAAEAAVRRELAELRPQLEREQARADAAQLELQRKGADFEKLLQTCAQLRSSLEESAQKIAKSEGSNEFLRREMMARAGGAASAHYPAVTTYRQVEQVAGRQEDLESLERSFQERQSQTIRELFEVRQQLERRALEVKEAENSLRVARQDGDHLRAEVRTAMDATAKLERQMEDAELAHERALREARAEERRATEADVAGQYRGRMVELERELQAAMDRTATLGTDLHFAQDTVRGMERRREAAAARDTAHLQELQRQMAQQAEQLKLREQEIGRIHASAEAEVQDMRAEVLVAQREAEAQRRARESIEAAARRQLAAVNSEMNQVDADVANLHRQLSDGSAAMHRAALQDELSAAKEQLAAAQREATSRRTQVVQLETQMNGAESRVLAEKGETATVRAELEASHRQLSVHREEIGSLQARLQAAQRTAADAVEAAEKKLRGDMDHQRRLLADAQADAVKLKAECDMLNRAALDSSARHASETLELKSGFARDRAEMAARIESLERELSAGSITAQITAWQRRLEDAASERDALRETAAALRRQMEVVERNAMSQHSELERQLHEQRRHAMIERGEHSGKASVMEMDLETLRKSVVRLRDAQEQHSRECPLGDHTVQQVIEEKRRLAAAVDELRDKELRSDSRVKALTADIAQMQRDNAEKEFEHLRELKVSKLEAEKQIAQLESQLQDAQQHITSQLNQAFAAQQQQQQQQHQKQQQHQPQSAGRNPVFQPPQQQPQQSQVHVVEVKDLEEEQHQQQQHVLRQKIRQLQDGLEDSERKCRKLQLDAEEAQQQLQRERSTAQLQEQHLRDAKHRAQQLQQTLDEQQQHQPQQQQLVPPAAQRSERRVAELEGMVARQRDAVAKLQKEKAAIQVQLMRRDDQLSEFETNHVARMLEEVNALRLARDKALLDCNRLSGDVQQLQAQLRSEAQTRSQLSGRVESNAAHVTTVHGSLRAVMLEAAGREQRLEKAIMKLQEDLRRAMEEKATVEATASATEQAAVGSTVRALQMAENHLARLLQTLLMLLELARDRPDDTLDSIASSIVGAVETATQALQYIRSEMGTVAAPLASAVASHRYNNVASPTPNLQTQQQQQQQQQLSHLLHVAPPAPTQPQDENVVPFSTPMLFYKQEHQAGASSSPTGLFPIVGTNGLKSALAPRSASSVLQSQYGSNNNNNSGTSRLASSPAVSAADLFAEAAAAKTLRRT